MGILHTSKQQGDTNTGRPIMTASVCKMATCFNDIMKDSIL